MKTNRNIALMYILLVVAQILVCNFINVGPYVFLTILPVMLLCLPLTIPPVPLMPIAAVSGLAVDWLAEGIVGLNVLAAVPVAFIRNTVVRLLLGKDHTERAEGFSFRKNGFPKISAAMLVCQAVFLAVYVVVDGAGTRPFLFLALRFTLSLICGYLISLPVFNMLTSNENQ